MDGFRHLSWVEDVSADHDGSREWVAEAMALISTATESAGNELKKEFRARRRKKKITAARIRNAEIRRAG